jgi:hypothetical protein
MDRSWQMRECKPEHGVCAGRSHFYALNDHDAEALFDILDAHHRAKADPQATSTETSQP